MGERYDRRVYSDPAVEWYKQWINRDEIRECLKLTIEERILRMQRLLEYFESAKRAMADLSTAIARDRGH